MRTQKERETEQHYDLFLSYSRRDSSEAMQLKTAIQSLGYSVFYDQEVLEGDSNWRKTIARHLDRCSGVVFLRTENSVMSKFCQNEVNIADECGKAILPVTFLHKQNSLPVSDELKLTLQPLQTTFISDFSSVANTKNELQTALEKNIGAPSNAINSLALTEFLNAAAENLSSRYRNFFEQTGARKFTSDIGSWQIALKWQFFLGDNAVNVCVALNKYSKRSDCYSNCTQHGECRFYNAKDLEEYSLEAFLEFGDRRRKSPVADLLEELLSDAGFPPLCGSWGIKYFFREKIMDGKEVNDVNDFSAVLLLLERSVEFYDKFMAAIQKYMLFAHTVCKIFQDEKLLFNILNPHKNEIEWALSGELRSSQKIHFYKKSVSPIDKNELGKYCTVAIEFPEALRIRVQAFHKEKILLKVSRFLLDKQVSFSFFLTQSMMGELENGSKTPETQESRKTPSEKLELIFREKIGEIFKKECKEKFSTIPDDIHYQIRDFIQNNAALSWNVCQLDNPQLSISGSFTDFPQVRFILDLTYHSREKKFDYERRIESDFVRAEEQQLAEVTGFSVGTFKSEKDMAKVLGGMQSSLDKIHKNVYAVYKKLKDLDDFLVLHWQTNKAATVLMLDNQKSSYIEGKTDSEKCWEYYLSPGTRLYRRLRKEFPVMFSVKFESSGARQATVGWCGDNDFNLLSKREKELFWHCVLLKFPPEIRGCFGFRNNAIFLTEKSHRENASRKARLFSNVDEVKQLLEEWTAEREEGTLMDQMFAVIEEAVEIFNV